MRRKITPMQGWWYTSLSYLYTDSVTQFPRIIKDFYLVQTDPSKRPRIFGMTASPVDAKVDIQQAARYKGLEME